MTTRDESEGWLVRSLRDARAKVAAWPEWKKEAMRVLPEPRSASEGAAAARADAGTQPHSDQHRD